MNNDKKGMSPEEIEINRARQRAVKTAWVKEKTQVFMGRGTRDWTPKEQQTLIEKGSIPGYYGHHMISVKNDAENAGNPDNIQFLTFAEHLEAHKGNFKNISNGYYDSENERTEYFENGEIIRPESQMLSNPIYEYVDLDEIMRLIQMEEENERINAEKMEGYSMGESFSKHYGNNGIIEYTGSTKNDEGTEYTGGIENDSAQGNGMDC